MMRASSSTEAVKDVSGLRQVSNGYDTFIHGGRPARNYGPPPALFHPALAKLDYHLSHLDEKLDELEVDAKFLHDVHQLIAESLAVYDSEDQRSHALVCHIKYLVGLGGEQQVASFQGDKLSVIWYHPFLSMILEAKNEYGIGGDALAQAALSYARVVGSDAVCPR